MTAVELEVLEPRPSRLRGLRLIGPVAVLLLALGGASAGTWAAFTASTTNDAGFSSGALILSNSKDGAAACFSTAAGAAVDDNDADCAALYDLEAKAPGDESSTAITLQNAGNIDASALVAFASGACTTGDAASADHHGTDPDLCDDIQLMIQQYSSAQNQIDDVRTGGTCRYGADATTDGVCDAFSSAFTLRSFTDDHSDNTEPIDLGPLADEDAGAVDTRWFRVFIRFDPAAGNATQGREATFGIRWLAVQ